MLERQRDLEMVLGVLGIERVRILAESGKHEFTPADRDRVEVSRSTDVGRVAIAEVDAARGVCPLPVLVDPGVVRARAEQRVPA
jgi:hypothetical protein